MESIKQIIKNYLGLTADETTITQMAAEIHALQNPTPVQPVVPVEPVPIVPVEPASVSSNVFYRPDTQLTAWIVQNPNDSRVPVLAKVDAQPTFSWFNGTESSANQNAAVVSRIQSALKLAAGKVFCLELYAHPDRDAGGQSAGGVVDVDSYKAYVGAIAYGIGQAGNPPVVVGLEADALADNLPHVYECLNAAIDELKKNSNTKVFIDASHPGWIAAADMAGRLNGAGVARADGIALNVSNYVNTADCLAYANQILPALGKAGLQCIIDTSRNGGTTAAGDWDNPNGAKIGQNPEIVNSGPVYAYAWIKVPSESDGTANGGPNAGSLWIERTVELAS